MKHRLLHACLMALAVGTAAPAVMAQATSDTQASKDADGGGPVDKLRDEGIALRFVLSNDWAASVRGGERLGATNGGGAVGGADLDMQKLFGITGAKMHITFARYFGHSLAATDIGITQKIQGYWYPARQWQLAQLTWEQQFQSSHINVLFGRVNATWQFDRSTYGCRFVSAPDCPEQLTNTTGGFSGFPYVNWGIRARWQPDARYVAIGAFEINPNRKLNHGLNWGFNESTGVMVPVEVGYESSFATDPYPRHLKIGGWYNSADYTDPRLNTKGLPRGLVGGTAQTYGGGRYGLYALGDKVVWKPDPNNDTRNLAVFAGLSGPLDSAETYTLQSTDGILWTGPFSSRPTDSIGVQATFYKFSKKQAGFEDDLIHKRHATDNFSRNETMLEFNYSYKLFPVLSIVPNIQYIIHPDILGNTTTVNRVPANALVVGVRFMLNMGGPGSQ